MLRLLQIELIKIWSNKSSRFLIISYFGLLTLLFLLSMVKIDFGSFEFHLAKQGIFDFPYIWHFNTYIADYFKLFLAIVIVSMVANEYSNKTLKQNLIDGLSKKEFILSKFLTTVLFALISTFMVFVISMILGLIYSSFDEMGIIFSQMEFLPAYFLKLVGFFSICLFFAVLTQKSAFSLGFLVLWSIVETIISGISSYNDNKLDFIVRFLPLKSMSNLIKEPFTRMSGVRTAANQVGVELSSEYGVDWIDVMITSVWIGIFIYFSYFLIKRRDL
ncbi:ABC transporter permease [Capnocytophaga stomatis]|uniref:ABC transporter permease n=1 Tax=Capnocytophaga stomatis TaxID=1848904 RepID=A0ABW8Q795_9FLAO|nr:ABC transporter permease subunit [Capnocytophaga stomatis]GIJ93417.1 ABC transporter permease [Capnocytophaga stomatis]